MTDSLKGAAIEMIELEVYETIINPVEMPNKPVSGILFYSPSAVEGFKQGTGFDEDLPSLFAIGPTTAKALKEHTNQPVQIASQPDTEVLLRTTADYIFYKAENIELG